MQKAMFSWKDIFITPKYEKKVDHKIVGITKHSIFNKIMIELLIPFRMSIWQFAQLIPGL